MANYNTKRSVKERIGAFFSKFSGFAKAAFVLVLAVLVVGLATIGTAQAPGRAFYAAKGAEVVFYLDYQNNKKLDKIYIDVGTIYAEAGSNQQLTFRRASTSISRRPRGRRLSRKRESGEHLLCRRFGDQLCQLQLGETLRPRGNGNKLSTTYKLIKATFPCDMLVNEIIFLDEDGKVIPTYVDHTFPRGCGKQLERFPRHLLCQRALRRRAERARWIFQCLFAGRCAKIPAHGFDRLFQFLRRMRCTRSCRSITSCSAISMRAGSSPPTRT